MAYFNDTWRVWFKGPSGDFREVSSVSWRNVLGSALVSAFGASDLYGQLIPMVRRYEVIAKGTGTVNLSVKTILLTDSQQPLTSPVNNWPTGVADWLWYGVDCLVSASAQVGDVFEIGEGYTWDEVTSQWLPQRAFGIVAQGEFGNVHVMRAQNISARSRAYVAVGWNPLDCPYALMQARELNGTWISQTDSPILVTGALGVKGLIEPNESFDIEFRPLVPDTAGSSYNPITFQMFINSEEI